jgi:preprotein translocase subunit SecF
MRADLNIDFIGKRKIYYTISLALIAIGVLVSLIFGVKLDIQFTGGAIIKYSYTGTVDKQAASNIATKTISGAVVDVTLDEDYGTHTKTVQLQFNKNLTSDQQEALFTAETAQFKSNALTKYSSTDVSPSMGQAFIQKSVLALILASLLIILYIWFRFRKIGGLPAGITAFIALLHDIVIGFVAFSVMRIPLNDIFIAVILTILGYSINDTIVIYDRVRENRKLYGSKIPFKDIVNKSINQSFARSINTSLVTFMAIAVLGVFSVIFHLDSVTAFALPMMVGVVTGCYSTICIAGPLWVSWESHKEIKVKAEKDRLSLEKEQRKLKMEEAKAKKLQ